MHHLSVYVFMNSPKNLFHIEESLLHWISMKIVCVLAVHIFFLLIVEYFKLIKLWCVKFHYQCKAKKFENNRKEIRNSHSKDRRINGQSYDERTNNVQNTTSGISHITVIDGDLKRMIYKTLRRKLHIEQHEPHWKLGVNQLVRN